MLKNFLGMTIEGINDDYRGQKRVPQISQEEVGALIHAVLSDPNVRGLAWTQYTPYYNDGDPCVFRACEPSISLHNLERQEYYDYSWMEEDSDVNNREWISPYSESFERLIGDDAKIWSGDWPNRTWVYKVPIEDQPNPSLFKSFMDLNAAMDNGSCDHALLDLFGDHATVLIDKESGKVIVEEYEHD